MPLMVLLFLLLFWGLREEREDVRSEELLPCMSMSLLSLSSVEFEFEFEFKVITEDGLCF